jgi:hypothetical protein
MKRQAILLSSLSTQAGDVNLPFTMWRNFLTSPLGGGWQEEEIEHPEGTAPSVLETVMAAQCKDYSLVIFMGEGEQRQADLPWKETSIRLSGGENLIAERQLNTGTPRLTMILDYCINFDISMPGAFSLGNVVSKFSAENLKLSRHSYDAALEKSEKGFVKIQPSFISSCGLFSQQLISTALRWAKMQDTNSVLTLNAIATEFSKSNEGNCSECEKIAFDYQGGRRLKHFPFAMTRALQGII